MIDRISIIVPAHDEAHQILPSLRRILRYARSRFRAWELIVVDDGSSDHTGALARSALGDQLRVIRHERRRGKGAAIRSGVLEATQPWLLFVDADLAVPPEELDRLLPATDAFPIVIGSKHMPGSSGNYPLRRRWSGRLGNLLISLLVVRGFRDTQCGFKLFRTDIARRLFALQHIRGFGFDFEILFLARRFGLPVAERAVHVQHDGSGNVTPVSYLAVLGDIALLQWCRLLGRYPRAPA